MSAINAYKKRKYGQYGVLYDLGATASGSSVFYSYRDKSEVGKEIFKELYQRFDKDQNGFYMDGTKTVGILSQCQSLQALLLLASDFDLLFDDKHLISETEENLTIREIMDIVIEDIIENRIKVNEKDRKKKGNEDTYDSEYEYIFDASPYNTGNHLSPKYSNVEAITWVIPCFLQALKYHAHEGETCKWEKDLIKIVSYGLKYLNRAFIAPKNVLSDAKSDKLEIGWNFTLDCEEPSLFYTFTVCECFVDFYETFGDYLKYKEEERNIKKGLIKDFSPKIKGEHIQHEKVFNERAKAEEPGRNEKGKQMCRYDEYNELRLHYIAINNGLEDIADTLYGELESNCKAVAHEIWRLTQDHLADKFFYNDLATRLSEEDIAMATTSDALFNTVYIINILLDSGLDEDFDLIRSSESEEISDADRETAERNYANLFDACQLASQKAFRAYEKLKSEGKDYIVDQFLIGFNESFTVHRDMVRELRKLRMRVFTLMPLLIRTNNVISEYLIKYPQVNMRKYLRYILENRYEENNKFKWIWENDGFFSCSNYYYVSALGEFYRYYEDYEKKHVEISEKNELSRKEIIKEYRGVLEGENGEIKNYKKQIENKDKEIATLEGRIVDKDKTIETLRTELDNVERPVEDAVADVAKAEIEKAVPALLQEMLPGMLSGLFASAAQGLVEKSATGEPCDPAYEALASAMMQFVLALMRPTIQEKVKLGRLTADDMPRMEALEASVKKEIKRCLRRFVTEISTSKDNQSSLFKQL